MKTIRVHIESPDGRLWVSAPVGTPLREIESMIRGRLARIRRKQELVRSRSAAAGRDAIDGQSFQILGASYCVRTEPETRGVSAWIDGQCVVVPAVASDDRDGIEVAVERLRVDLLRQEISRLLPIWEARIGRQASWWGIRRMTSRWGSCSVASGRIRFAAALAQRDPRLIEYIVLHELAHLIVPNHGPDFVALMNLHMPDWKERRSALHGKGSVPA